MRRILKKYDIVSSIKKGDSFLRKGNIDNLLDAEIEYDRRVWKVTDLTDYSITLED